MPSLNKFVSHPHETKIFGFKASKKKVSGVVDAGEDIIFNKKRGA